MIDESHYDCMSIEPIEVMKSTMSQEEYNGFLLGNIIKYVMRAGFKGDALEDLEKAQVYLQWLVDEYLDMENEDEDEDCDGCEICEDEGEGEDNLEELTVAELIEGYVRYLRGQQGK